MGPRASIWLCLCGLALSTAHAEEPGVTDDEVLLGMSTVLSGPAQALGLGMKLGVERGIAQINERGGINGRKIRLVALDDGYEPARTAPHMRQLIEKDRVFAIIGNVGTPTALVAVPIAMETKTPLFGCFTGAGVLRKTPPDRYVINYRASYEQETGEMVRGLISDAGYAPEDFAFFTQKDGFGDSGYVGGIKALKAAGYAKADALPHGRYERNTTDIEEGLAVIAGADPAPKVVIMVGTYKPCAKLIKDAGELGFQALFTNVSFVGSEALAQELGDAGDGVVVTQCVPLPWDESLPLVKDYRAALGDSPPGFVSLEGYIALRVFSEGLTKAGPSLTREGYIDALEGIASLDVGLGVPLSFGREDHQACDTVWPTVIRGGKFQPLRWAELKK